MTGQLQYEGIRRKATAGFFLSTAQSTSARQQKAELHPIPVRPWPTRPVFVIDGPVIPGEACACGGGCPPCREEPQKMILQTNPANDAPGDPYEEESDRAADEMTAAFRASTSRMEQWDSWHERQCWRFGLGGIRRIAGGGESQSW